jgi:hypothetical protein
MLHQRRQDAVGWRGHRAALTRGGADNDLVDALLDAQLAVSVLERNTEVIEESAQAEQIGDIVRPRRAERHVGVDALADALERHRMNVSEALLPTAV